MQLDKSNGSWLLSVHIQIAPTSVLSTPSWLGEVAVLAHVFNQFGLQKAIEERVRFARARMGDYEVIDFVVMLMGYAPLRRTYLRDLLSTIASVCRILRGTLKNISHLLVILLEELYRFHSI